ncbi:aldose epimerase family protein [Luteolibacter algae]|uniref:Aldose 1-epimerase n=1 Tax=Luteolibacter algae TaxID=454151 RepID=A0ABW5DC68_9BACT
MKTYLLSHPSGITATVSDFGATLRTLSTADQHGRFENILVGFENPEDWADNEFFFGVTVGRFANRIANGTFTLNGVTHKLETNDSPNHLHGGINGFDKALWETEFVSDECVRFAYLSPDGEEGFPGNLKVTVEYSLGEDFLKWKATATTDKATPVSLTNHAYFNLTGTPSESVLDHVLNVKASKYLPLNENCVPSGDIAEVAGTAFDFTNPQTIGHNLAKSACSFDHNFVLDGAQESRVAAIATDPKSGRVLELSTNHPGLQFYLDSPFGNPTSAFCLEPQHFPDSPNISHFPSPILQPGDTYHHEITLRFPKAEA